MLNAPAPDPTHSSQEEVAARARHLPKLRVVLAAPRGFCAGVRRAIAAVEDVLEKHGPPVYVRRAIVHNLAVVRALEAKGAIFVEELFEVPEGAVVVFSAHGVPPGVRAEAQRRGLQPYDAVCPLVSKVHREVIRHNSNGRHVILVGHKGHPEIVGTLGQIPLGAATLVQTAAEVEHVDLSADTPVAYAVQTTFSVEDAADAIAALRSKFIDLAEPPSNDICYATTNRQSAIASIASSVDAIVVVGEDFSSNASRLAEVARASGCGSVQLVADSTQLDWALLPSSGSVGVTAAASTPEVSVSDVIRALRTKFDVDVEEFGDTTETTTFKPLKIA